MLNLIAIVNASPLIYLGKLGRLDLLRKIFTQVITTEIVRKEVLREKNTPEHTVLEEVFESQIEIRNVKNNNLMIRLEKMDIHKGQASIIGLAKEMKKKNKASIIVIDDLATRDISRTMNLRITGTIGILLKTLKEGVLTVEECKSLTTKLVTEASFRTTIKIYTKLLQKIDEINKQII